MVHLYFYSVCRNKIPADDNRIHCSECGSEICGSCYLRRRTSHFHKADHTQYMISECSGSMYIHPPMPPDRLAPKANGTPKRAKSAAARKIASLKRKHANNEGVNQPAIATETTASINRNDPNRCEKCRKHHQRCSGPTKDGSCKRCRAKKYKDCDLRTLAQDGTANKESSSELSTSLSGTSLSPEPTKFSSSSTGLFGNYSTPRDREFSPNSLLDGTSISGDCEASQSKSPQPAIRRKLVCRRNLPDYMFDE